MLNRSKKNYSRYNALSGRSRNTRRKRNNYRKKFGGTITLSRRLTSPRLRLASPRLRLTSPRLRLASPILTSRSRHLRN